MQLECTGRQVTITKGLRSLAEEGIERIRRVLGRSGIAAHIVLTAEKHRKIVEVTVKTRARKLVAVCESSFSMESALRDALAKAETQALRHRNKMRSIKRQPSEAKQLDVPVASRTRGLGKAAPEKSPGRAAANGAGAKAVLPVTVHSFPSRVPIAEPHIVRSTDSVALRPMTLEEAVKEAEFRDREVFVFRDDKGNVMVLHRKRDGKMELIEAP
ncbi:MAG TPA: HPF/RaiA family ribosome-associated protein [Acidobacteriaceae bacterium]|jgi:putative sigma-54 modulation protein|nr:HPF/RaiA family ribosome-associated protein [Acidobacteriaceae bacterium]